MQKITRKVRDLRSDERRMYEAALGEPLRENQIVILQVVNLGEAPEMPEPAGGKPVGKLPDWCNVYEGLTDEEIAQVEGVVLRRSDMARPS